MGREVCLQSLSDAALVAADAALVAAVAFVDVLLAASFVVLLLLFVGSGGVFQLLCDVLDDGGVLRMLLLQELRYPSDLLGWKEGFGPIMQAHRAKTTRQTEIMQP